MKRINALQRGICFAWIAAAVMIAADGRAADSAPELKAVRAVMKEKCFSCHGEKKQKESQKKKQRNLREKFSLQKIKRNVSQKKKLRGLQKLHRKRRKKQNI